MFSIADHMEAQLRVGIGCDGLTYTLLQRARVNACRGVFNFR